jgi:hypothetical protein
MSVVEREYQYEHLASYYDRYNALKTLSNHLEDAGAKETMMKALHDRFWGLREFVVEKLGNDSTPEMKHTLIELTNDSAPNVRAGALSALSSTYKDGSLMPVYKKALNDSSYKVESEGLNAIGTLNKQEAMACAKKLENTDDGDLLIGIAVIYTQFGNDSCNNFFVKAHDNISGVVQQVEYVALYSKFLQQCSDSVVKKGVSIIGDVMKNTDNRYVKYYAKNGLSNLYSLYDEKVKNLNIHVTELKTTDSKNPQLIDLQKKIDSATVIETMIGSYIQ